MHVVFREAQGLEETDVPMDLGQSPADLVVLSFSDSDLGAFSEGWKKEKDADGSDIDVWICRNSYGEGYGMNGDFYVRMGSDDFGIESEVHAYEVQSLS